MAAPTCTMPVYMRIGDGEEACVGELTLTGTDAVVTANGVSGHHMAVALRAIADSVDVSTEAEHTDPR